MWCGSGSSEFSTIWLETRVGNYKMAGVPHDQSVNKVVADSHDDVMFEEELNQETTDGEEAVNLKKTFSESELEIGTGVKTLFEGADLQMEE